MGSAQGTRVETLPPHKPDAAGSLSPQVSRNRGEGRAKSCAIWFLIYMGEEKLTKYRISGGLPNPSLPPGLSLNLEQNLERPKEKHPTPAKALRIQPCPAFCQGGLSQQHLEWEVPGDQTPWHPAEFMVQRNSAVAFHP